MTPEEKTVAEASCDAAHIERQEPTRTQAEWEAWARDIEKRVRDCELSLAIYRRLSPYPARPFHLEIKRLEEQP